MICNILDNNTELYIPMTKYIIGEIFSSGRATLYKSPSDQTVLLLEVGVPTVPVSQCPMPNFGYVLFLPAVYVGATP